MLRHEQVQSLLHLHAGEGRNRSLHNWTWLRPSWRQLWGSRQCSSRQLPAVEKAAAAEAAAAKAKERRMFAGSSSRWTRTDPK